MEELEQLRQEIDRLDKIIAENIKMRLKIGHLIGTCKKKNSLPLENKEREEEVIRQFTGIAGPNTRPIIEAIITATKEQESRSAPGLRIED